MGPPAQRLRGRERRFFASRIDMADGIVPLKDTAQKHVINTSRHSPQTQTTPAIPKWDPDPQMDPRAISAPKKSKLARGAHPLFLASRK